MKLLILLLAMSNSVHARWAAKGDLSYLLLNESSDIVVKKDGTYSVIQIMEYEVLKETGKEKFLLYKIPYSSSQSKVEVLEANVKNGNTTEIVKKDKIVDKNISQEKGLSDSKIIQVTMPNIQVGSRIFIKYKTDNFVAVVPGHFSISFQIGEDNQAEESETKITSDIPLHIHKIDPFDILNVRETNEKKKFQLHVRVRGPYNKNVIDERGFLSFKKKTYYKVSTDKDWNRIGNSFKSRFDKTLSQPLPKELNIIAEEAKKISDLTQKVNHVGNYIVKNYNYTGDWRTSDGSFSPRKLEEIISTKYGDCKDFSVIMTSILRKAGINAEIALVIRAPSQYVRYVSHEMPGVDLFNHAIVRVNQDKNVYWIDPTNPTTFGLQHRNDIADRPALTLNGKNLLEKIPEVTEEGNEISINKTIHFESDKAGTVEANLKIKGRLGLLFTGMELTTPKENINQSFMNILSQGEQAVVPEISPYDLKSKQYLPIDLNAKYSASELSMNKDGKTFVKIPTMTFLLQGLRQDFKDWQGDLYLGDPQTFNRTITLKGIFAQRRPRGCSISTEWLDVKRVFNFTPEGIVLTEHLNIKNSFVTQDRFETTDFKVLQEEIQQCLLGHQIQFDWTKKQHAESEIEIEKRFAKLPTKERIEKRYQFAFDVKNDKIETNLSKEDMIFFLKKNISEDNSHIKSYLLYSIIVLDLGYLSGEQYNKANILESQKILSEGLYYSPNNQSLTIQYLRTQYFMGEMEAVKNAIPKVLAQGEIKDPYSLITLGRIYNGLGDKNNALATIGPALKKATTSDEKEKVWFALGVIYSSHNDYKKCVGAYTQVLKINPKNAYSHVNIIRCHLALGEFDQAVERAKKGQVVASSGNMNYWTASALIERAKHYVKNKRTEDAEKDFKESLHIKKLSDAYEGLANIAVSKKDYDRAVTLILEGTSHYEGNKIQFITNFQPTLFKASPDHFYNLVNESINRSHTPGEKLWGYYNLGRMFHEAKKREELYQNLEKGIALGELILKSGRVDASVLIPLGAIYGLYGIDADSLDLLGQGKLTLNMAKGLVAEADQPFINSFIGVIQKEEDDINNGRISEADLNFNMKFKSLAQSKSPPRAKPMPRSSGSIVTPQTLQNLQPGTFMIIK